MWYQCCSMEVSNYQNAFFCVCSVLLPTELIEEALYSVPVNLLADLEINCFYSL